jgi:hypothetical protein
MERYNRYVKWVLFTAAITVLPLLADLLSRSIAGRNIKIIELIKGGQLFLIACCLSASGFGEILFYSNREQRTIFSRLLIGFLSIIALFASAISYGTMASKLAEMNPITTNLHIQLQIGCFITSFISGLSAQKFAE